ncbi:(2Fe-2S)-binding protein [Muricauda sp. 2012CJ35-5]|uniref:(2Fe-2S)-binding protein n=1 Tax=Flagellimonas spongiicola TaxID=2942208 RepID=A0ABT0PQY5_9FLAO|nr:(2Fe-2S)-binding protein [Allomuricauda spongiicola]MCL6273386.1 (2Fe-2S)-binding protein [Allomuricauda spongiicola]
MKNLMINGELLEVDAHDNMPLLWALRDVLDMTGTKYGCGKGLCGACTVHVDGEAVRSCTIPISALEGKEITTIEGSAVNPILEKVQDAWYVTDVPQCGYCQSGQMMSAAALLAKNSNPSQDAIHSAMNGNLCRCGTYVRIRKAIRAAADNLDQNAN